MLISIIAARQLKVQSTTLSFKIYFIGRNMLSTSKSGQELMVVELIDNRGECNALFYFFMPMGSE